MWQVLSGCLETCQYLVYRHLGTKKDYPRCGADNESINHMLFECPPTLQFWAMSHIPSMPSYFPSPSSIQQFGLFFLEDKGDGGWGWNLALLPLDFYGLFGKHEIERFLITCVNPIRYIMSRYAWSINVEAS